MSGFLVELEHLDRLTKRLTTAAAELRSLVPALEDVRLSGEAACSVEAADAVVDFLERCAEAVVVLGVQGDLLADQLRRVSADHVAGDDTAATEQSGARVI
jgi:hypothetical protein